MDEKDIMLKYIRIITTIRNVYFRHRNQNTNSIPYREYQPTLISTEIASVFLKHSNILVLYGLQVIYDNLKKSVSVVDLDDTNKIYLICPKYTN